MARRDERDARAMARIKGQMYTTLPKYLHPLMEVESHISDHCVICGRRWPLNNHHIVRRGAGRLYGEDGVEVEKPIITLCGFGNTLAGPDGYYCHGMAHQARLHFRNIDGELHYLITKEPMKYLDTYCLPGWKKVSDVD